MSMAKEDEKIESLKKQLLELGPMLPGSISEQWNVCGTPGCKCKDAKHPVKHGPYYQLSFTAAGKSSTLFVKKRDLAEARRRNRRHRRFKELVKQLTLAHVETARKHGLERS
jgi:hypothetical protein